MYTKRLSAEANKHEEFSYEDFPETLKTQIFYAIEDCLGDGSFQKHRGAQRICLYKAVVEHLRREYGKTTLPGRKFIPMDDDAFNELKCFIINGGATEEIIDVIEVVYRLKFTLEGMSCESGTICERFDEMEQTINKRFSESNFGYKLINGEVVKHTSDYISSFVVEPAIRLLHTSGYEGAVDEFAKALKHHRKGDFKSSIVNANNCFESTLKTACKKIGIAIGKGDTASKLVVKYIDGISLPSYKREVLNNVSKLMQSSTNTIRNKNGGHGQGDSVVDVPEELSELCLNMAASIVAFIVNTERAQS